MALATARRSAAGATPCSTGTRECPHETTTGSTEIASYASRARPWGPHPDTASHPDRARILPLGAVGGLRFKPIELGPGHSGRRVARPDGGERHRCSPARGVGDRAYGPRVPEGTRG